MKTKVICILSLGLFLALISCTQKMDKVVVPPEDLIHRDTLVNILVDLRLYEATMAYEQRQASRKLNDKKYFLYKSIINKHNITREQFERSYEFYQEDIRQMDEIYADVITKLSLLKSQVNAEE